MASLTLAAFDAEVIENVLTERSQGSLSSKNRTLRAFDKASGQFVLLREGWSGYERHHYAWIHIELKDGKFWIHRDGTEDGVTGDLLKAGIPKERIVLAFQHPVRRERGEIAVG